MSDKVNLNSASRDEISKRVSGIGDEMAEAIVRYRDSHGSFRNMDELHNVPGISTIRFEKLRDQSEV